MATFTPSPTKATGHTYLQRPLLFANLDGKKVSGKFGRLRSGLASIVCARAPPLETSSRWPHRCRAEQYRFTPTFSAM